MRIKLPVRELEFHLDAPWIRYENPRKFAVGRIYLEKHLFASYLGTRTFSLASLCRGPSEFTS